MSYVDDLKLMIGAYMRPLIDLNILPSEIVQKIFYGIESILLINENIASRLKNYQKYPKNQVPIGQIYESLVPFLKSYVTYCQHHTEAIELLSKWERKKKDLPIWLMETAQTHCRGLTLHDFLIKPLQRLCKYPLLFSGLLQCTDKDSPEYITIEKSLNKINVIVKDINEVKKKSLQFIDLVELEARIHDYQDKIVDSSRQFIKEVKVQIITCKKSHVPFLNKRHKTQERTLLLLSDKLLICKRKKGITARSNALAFKTDFMNNSIRLTETPDDFSDYDIAFVIEGINGGDMVDVVFCDTPEDKEHFLKAFQQITIEINENSDNTQDTVSSEITPREDSITHKTKSCRLHALSKSSVPQIPRVSTTNSLPHSKTMTHDIHLPSLSSHSQPVPILEDMRAPSKREVKVNTKVETNVCVDVKVTTDDILFKNAALSWVNIILSSRDRQVSDLSKDLSDGVNLIHLVEIISGQTLSRYNKNPRFMQQKIENITSALTLIEKSLEITCYGINPKEIMEGNEKQILALIFLLSKHNAAELIHVVEREDRDLKREKRFKRTKEPTLIKKTDMPLQMESVNTDNKDRNKFTDLKRNKIAKLKRTNERKLIINDMDELLYLLNAPENEAKFSEFNKENRKTPPESRARKIEPLKEVESTPNIQEKIQLSPRKSKLPSRPSIKDTITISSFPSTVVLNGVSFHTKTKSKILLLSPRSGNRKISELIIPELAKETSATRAATEGHAKPIRISVSSDHGHVKQFGRPLQEEENGKHTRTIDGKSFPADTRTTIKGKPNQSQNQLNPDSFLINKALQEALSNINNITPQTPVTERVYLYQRLDQLSDTFVDTAKNYVQTIINELNLPQDQCSLRLPNVNFKDIVNGGTFTSHGITYTWTGQSKYANPEHKKLRISEKYQALSFLSIQNYMNLGIQNLHYPFVCVIDYLGFRVSCKATIPPIKSTQEQSPQLEPFIKQMTDKFKISNQLLAGLTVRAAEDDKLYIIDPPFPTPIEPNKSSASLGRYFRQELAHTNLTTSDQGTTVSEQFKTTPFPATSISSICSNASLNSLYLLYNEVIPVFAQMLDELVESEEESEDSERGAGMQNFDFITELHFYGINVRHLGRIYELVESKFWKNFIFIEMMARTFKTEMNNILKYHQQNLNQSSTSKLGLGPIKTLIVHTLNLFLGSSTESLTFWIKKILPLFSIKFQIDSPSPDSPHLSHILTRHKPKLQLLHRLAELLHLAFSPALLPTIAESPEFFNQPNPLPISSITAIQTKHKLPNIALYAKAYLLLHQTGPTPSRWVLQEGMKLFKEVLRGYPRDKRAFIEMADLAGRCSNGNLAEMYFLRAYEIDERFQEALGRYAEFLGKENRKEEERNCREWLRRIKNKEKEM
uniref:DH domain-containing protein n=1 Tax=Arcella intermedia TaxID=1963864 RepID=A0A6B2KWK3_9EUKA